MNILLCCSAGMSTSLLVSRMEEVARDQGLDCKIWAEGVDAVKQHASEANVILLGPQVRYLLPQLKKVGEEFNVPVDAINPVDYGTVNGAAVLKTALSLAKK